MSLALHYWMGDVHHCSGLSSPKWLILCREGRWTLLYHTIPYQRPTNSLKFYILTAMSVVHLPDLTRGHQHDQHSLQWLQFMVHGSPDTRQLVEQSQKTSLIPTLAWKFLQQLPCSRHKFQWECWTGLDVQSYWTGCLQTCKNVLFALLWKQCKVQ